MRSPAKPPIIAGVLLGLGVLGLVYLATRAQDAGRPQAVPQPPPATPVAGRPPVRAERLAPPRRVDPANVPGAPAAKAESSETGGLAAATPRGNIIEFVVNADGLAIAYGDQILGAVTDGSGITRGFHDAPAPNLWDKPEIPYLVHPALANPERVEAAVRYFNEHTVVKWVPRRDQPDAVVFEPGSEHCYSYLGKIGGLQPIRLAEGCQAPEIVHEMLHALGFIHEQSRTDRDGFIDVAWENIEERYRPQFATVPESFMEVSRLAPFDFASAMLYRPEAFALGKGRPTMTAKRGAAIAPVREGISEGDAARLRRLYRLD
jgi:hypothetical protein